MGVRACAVRVIFNGRYWSIARLLGWAVLMSVQTRTGTDFCLGLVEWSCFVCRCSSVAQSSKTLHEYLPRYGVHLSHFFLLFSLFARTYFVHLLHGASFVISARCPAPPSFGRARVRWRGSSDPTTWRCSKGWRKRAACRAAITTRTSSRPSFCCWWPSRKRSRQTSA